MFALFTFLQRTILVIMIRESEVAMSECQIDQLIEDVIEREGGYVDHPADRGGPTRWGITQAVARRQGYMDDMRALPQSDAAAIYKRLYWFAPAFDKVAENAPKLAAELFDTGINMGTGTAIGFLQRALNALNREARDYGDLTVDRRIGPATVLALNAFLRKRGKAGEEVLLKAVEALQGAHYVRLAETRPSQEAFLYGWLANRIG
jgi:lysozyme family protein